MFRTMLEFVRKAKSNTSTEKITGKEAMQTFLAEIYKGCPELTRFNKVDCEKPKDFATKFGDDEGKPRWIQDMNRRCLEFLVREVASPGCQPTAGALYELFDVIEEL